MAESPPVKQIILTVNVANGKVLDVEAVGHATLKTCPEITLEDLSAADLKHVGVMFHQHRNPSCFYFQYLGSIWEICF